MFAMGWFLTAFAHGTAIRTVERVWDALIIHDDCTLLHFIAVATIMHFREDLLNAQVGRSVGRSVASQSVIDTVRLAQTDFNTAHVGPLVGVARGGPHC